MVDVRTVSYTRFNQRLKQFRDDNPEMAAFITIPVEDKATHFLTEDADAGFAITDDGELVGVFNDGPSTIGGELVEKAIEYHATHLNCFDTKLVDLYSEYGFEIVDRIEWDEQYAPDDWNYERFGRPDVVIMEVDN